jgi:Hydrogenase maturation factor
MADVSFGGISKKVCLEWLPDVREGEYVIVHVGFAISKVDEEERRRHWKRYASFRRSATLRRGT